MAFRKKKTAGITYNRLIQEVSRINAELPADRQLSIGQRRKLVREELYPTYKDLPKSKIRITALRKDLGKAVKKAVKQIKGRGYDYHFLVKEVSNINRLLPEDRKLSIQEVYDLLSQKIYPKYKDVPKHKLRLTKLREELYNEIQKLPRKVVCSVFDVPEALLNEIVWHEIDETIKKLFDCIWIKINASDFGETKIFNTRNYKYSSSGVQEITNNINAWVAGRRQVYPYYDGIIQVRPGKKNDGKEDSYYIEYVLKGTEFVVDIKEIETPKRKKKPGRQKRDIRIKKYIEQKTKQLQAEKSHVKIIRKRLAKGVADFKSYLKVSKRMQGKKFTAKRIKEDYKKQYQSEKSKVDKQLKKKAIDTYQYDSLIKFLKKEYRQ